MTYRLTLDDEVGDALRTVAREELEAAADGLDHGHASDPVEAVHDARKRLKKTRSALRLARPAMRTRDYRTENRRLRDRGRALSGARDADVMVETIDALSERFAGQAPAALFDAVRERLAERAAAVREDAGEDVASEAAALHALAARVDEWPVERASADTLVRGLERSYVRGRDAFARADRRPTTTNLHEFRKRVKDLWYHERLLGEVWPGMMKAHAKESKTLSQLLGDDHDLAVLEALLADEEVTRDVAADIGELLEMIAHRREELLAEIRALGRRVYAEPPKAFRRRMRRYIRIAVTEAPPAVVGA
jgi:CHAD domain-containing protein